MSSSARPRSKSTFSFRSHKSDKANGARPKIDLHETEEEKRKQKFTTKTNANPNLSIVEAQPSAVAEMKSNIADMRTIQHKDRFGNPITDPDASNPTRSRFERPLDTIRSFEQAIDNGYKRRSDMIRAESVDAMNNQSRRTSYYSNDLSYAPRTPIHGGYSSSRLGSLKQGSYVDNYGPASSGYMHQQRRSMQRPSNRYSQDYSPHGYHEPYDNVHTGESSGSASTEVWGNSTDPSSENSSIDRIHTLIKPDGAEGAGGNGYYTQPSPVRRTIHEEYDQPERRHASQHQQQGPYQSQYRHQPPNSYGAPPPPQSQPQPRQQQQQQQQPQSQKLQSQKLGAAAPPMVQQWGPANTAPAARPPVNRMPSEKKGWLKRTFSKK